MASNLFGKLTPYNTFVHRMDPRLKLFALIVLMVCCFLPYGNAAYLASDGTPVFQGYYANQFLTLGILAVVILITMILSRVSFSQFLKSLSAMWIMVIFLLIIMVFVPQSGTNTALFHPIYAFSNGYTIYWDGVLQCLQVVLRIAMMLALTLILTSTTPPMDITYALEWYLTPLRLIKIPTQIISMTLSLALRFIPTLLDETHRIMRAQRSRGVDFNKGFISAKLKSITTLIVPLLISCISRSDELALAMDARGYDPYGKRSRYRVLTFHVVDLVSIILLLVILGFFIMLCVFAKSYGVNFWEFFGVKGTW